MPVGFDPETNIDEVIFLPIYLSILTFENEEVPWKVNDLFTSKGETRTSEVMNGLKMLIHS